MISALIVAVKSTAVLVRIGLGPVTSYELRITTTPLPTSPEYGGGVKRSSPVLGGGWEGVDWKFITQHVSRSTQHALHIGEMGKFMRVNRFIILFDGDDATGGVTTG